MSMTTRATIDDLYKVEGNAELVNGEIVHMPPTGDDPSYASGEIFVHLQEHAKRTRRGRAYGDGVGFHVHLPHRESGYTLKAGHILLSMTERDLGLTLSSPRQDLKRGDHRCKALGARPSDKARRGCRAIRCATIALVEDGPHLGALLRHAPLRVLHWCQTALAPFDGRRGALKAFAPVGGPRCPLRQAVGGQPPRAGVPLKRGAHGV